MAKMLARISLEVTDTRVINAMRTVPRHKFISAELQRQAYEDSALGIGSGQTISQPLIVALMTKAADLKSSDHVLEIGTGSGYQSAVLAQIVRQVITVERIKALRLSSIERLAQLNINNVRCLPAKDELGALSEAPFDAILVTAAAPNVPQGLINQLAEGGRLVIPVGNRDEQQLLQITKFGPLLKEHSFGGCRFVPLIGPDAFSAE